MTNSPAEWSYADIAHRLDEALNTPKGLVLKFWDREARNRYGYRIFGYRKIKREQNRLIYPDPTMAQHNSCAYDLLVVRMPKNPTPEGQWLLELRKIDNDGHTAEPIS